MNKCQRATWLKTINKDGNYRLTLWNSPTLFPQTFANHYNNSLWNKLRNSKEYEFASDRPDHNMALPYLHMILQHLSTYSIRLEVISLSFGMCLVHISILQSGFCRFWVTSWNRLGFVVDGLGHGRFSRSSAGISHRLILTTRICNCSNQMQSKRLLKSYRVQFIQKGKRAYIQLLLISFTFHNSFGSKKNAVCISIS